MALTPLQSKLIVKQAVKDWKAGNRKLLHPDNRLLSRFPPTTALSPGIPEGSSEQAAD